MNQRHDPERPSERGPGPRGAAGYTLIEMIAVIGLIAVLSGIGVGLLRTVRNQLETAAVAVREVVRSGVQRARFQRAPARLVLHRGSLGEEPSRLELWGLQLAGEWNFDLGDNGSPDGVYGQRGRLEGGAIEAKGRHGHALVCDGRAGNGLVVELGDSADFDLRRGLVAHCDLWLDVLERSTAVLVEKTLSIGVDERGIPEAELSLEGQGAEVGSRVTLRAVRPLPTGEWHRLEVEAFEGSFVFRVDGVEVDRQQRDPGRVFWNRQGRLILSDGGLPVTGRIDSVRFYGYEPVRSFELPVDVEVLEAPDVLELRADGRPDPRFHPVPPAYVLSYQGTEQAIRLDASGMPR